MLNITSPEIKRPRTNPALSNVPTPTNFGPTLQSVYGEIAPSLHESDLHNLHPTVFGHGQANIARRLQSQIGKQKFNQETAECVLVFSIPQQCQNGRDPVFDATKASDNSYIRESMTMPERQSFALKSHESGADCHTKALCKLFMKMFQKLKNVCNYGQKRNGTHSTHGTHMTGFIFQTDAPLLTVTLINDAMIIFTLRDVDKHFTFTLPCEADRGLHNLGQDDFSHEEAMEILNTLHEGPTGSIKIMTDDEANSVTLHDVRIKLFV